MSDAAAPKLLFLDDDPDRHQAMLGRSRTAGMRLLNVHSLSEFIGVLNNDGPFAVVSLDHDLNDFDARSYTHDGSEATGLDACGFLVSEGLRHKLPARITIHSVNPRGALEMKAFLERRGFDVEWKPFDESELPRRQRRIA